MATTWNPSDVAATWTLSNGNRTTTSNSGGAWGSGRDTVSNSSGKFYFEILIVSTAGAAVRAGMATSAGTLAGNPLGTLGGSSFGVDDRGVHAEEGTFAQTVDAIGGWTFTAADVIGIAADMGAGLAWVAKNNTYTTFSTGANPAAGTHAYVSFTAGSTLFAAGSVFANPDAITLQADTAVFSFSPPAGFSPWGGIGTVYRRTSSALGTRAGTRQAVIT